MRPLVLMMVVMLLAACNLNSAPATPTAPPPGQPTTAPATPLPATALSVPTAGATNTPAIQSSGTLASRFGSSTLTERVDITTPTNGASVSANPLNVSGIVYNLTGDHINLQLLDANNQALTPVQAIALSNPTNATQLSWSASLTAGTYTGAAQLKVTDVFGKVIGTTSLTIVASGSAAQPSGGSYVGSITAPTNGSSVSGDPITITGTAGGIAENQFTLRLLAADGTTLNSQPITLTGADQYTVPWSATLGTSGYHGQAELQAVATSNGQSITLASVTFTLQ